MGGVWAADDLSSPQSNMLFVLPSCLELQKLKVDLCRFIKDTNWVTRFSLFATTKATFCGKWHLVTDSTTITVLKH